MLKIRIAVLKDLPNILELEKRNGESTSEDLRALFQVENPNEKCRFFVAEESGEMVGYSRMHIYKWNNSALITTVLVDLQHRRRGIGTRLLKAMEDFARENKARVLMTDVPPDNIPAIQLDLKNGFKMRIQRQNLSRREDSHLPRQRTTRTPKIEQSRNFECF